MKSTLDFSQLIPLGETSFVTAKESIPNKNQDVFRAYIRCSTSMQTTDGYTVDAQSDKIKDFVNYKNGMIISWYYDLGISAKSTDNRLALEKLRSEIKPNETLIVASLSRLSRSIYDAMEIFKECEEKHVSIYALDINMDSKSSLGKFCYTLLASIAHLEREQISERIRNSMGSMSYNKKLKTRAPYGWKNVAKGVDHVINPDEMSVIDEIRQWKKETPTMSVNQIVFRLNKDLAKYKPRGNSKCWYPSTLSAIMRRNKIPINAEEEALYKKIEETV
jgi:DNA invertase Pin-like site-specific DNA recombinase